MVGEGAPIPSSLLDDDAVKLFLEEIRLSALECSLSSLEDLSKIVNDLKKTIYSDDQ